MGLFSFFSKDASIERKRQSASKRLTNMYVQSQDRMAAAHEMASLAHGGDEKAFRILMSRFNLLNPSPVVDLEEKEEILGLLVQLGQPVVEWTKESVIQSSESIHWPMLFLEKVLSDDDFRAFVAFLAAKTEAGYAREPKKKLNIVQLIGKFPNDDSREEVAKFLEDHDEQVRFQTIGVMLRIDCPNAQELLAARWASEDETSGRIYAEIAEAFSERGWSVNIADLAVLRPRCSHGFRIEDSGLVTR